MPRIHLFEFEDQFWFPAFIRNYGTDFLQFLANATKMYKPLVPVFKKALELSNTQQLIDLGSGGGGGLLGLNTALQKEVSDLNILLTDYYPNISAFQQAQRKASNITYLEKSVDARNVPNDLKGLRTLFLVFHHFKPTDALQILQNAVDTKAPIAVVEAQERSFASILAMLFSPISVLLTTPFIRPFRLGRIIFTYLIPIVPLFVLWDGVVSSLRTYSVKEMNALIQQVQNYESFTWEVKRIKSGPAYLLYLIGIPKSKIG